MALTVRASARPVLAVASAAPKAAKPVAKAPKVRRRAEEMRALQLPSAGKDAKSRP